MSKHTCPLQTLHARSAPPSPQARLERPHRDGGGIREDLSSAMSRFRPLSRPYIRPLQQFVLRLRSTFSVVPCVGVSFRLIDDTRAIKGIVICLVLFYLGTASGRDITHLGHWRPNMLTIYNAATLQTDHKPTYKYICRLHLTPTCACTCTCTVLLILSPTHGKHEAVHQTRHAALGRHGALDRALVPGAARTAAHSACAGRASGVLGRRDASANCGGNGGEATTRQR